MSHSTNTTTADTTTFGNTAVMMQQEVCVSSAIENGNDADAAVSSSRSLHDGHHIISRVFTYFLHSYLSVFRFPWAQTNTYLLWAPRASPRSASTQIPRTTNHGPSTSSNITSITTTLPPPPDSRVITIDGSPTDGSVTDARPGIRGHEKHGVSKEISTVTKLLFAMSMGAILLNANGSKEYNSVEANVERTIHLMAIIMMIVGIYIRVHWPTSSKWLQKTGQLMSLFCLIIIHTPLLKLPLPFSCLLLLLLSVILILASYLSD